MYKASEERYSGGGQVIYLVYKSPQPLRNGKTTERTRVKRLYFPAKARDVTLGNPAVTTKQTGRKVFGVPVRYEYRLASARARRGKNRYELPERWAQRTKIVELPERATAIRLTSKPPEGPRMAIA